jgi:hypothetical protein
VGGRSVFPAHRPHACFRILLTYDTYDLRASQSNTPRVVGAVGVTLITVGPARVGERAGVWAMFVLIGNLVALMAYALTRRQSA